MQLCFGREEGDVERLPVKVSEESVFLVRMLLGTPLEPVFITASWLLASQLPCRMPVSSASEERGDRDAVREKGTVEVVVT